MMQLAHTFAKNKLYWLANPQPIDFKVLSLVDIFSQSQQITVVERSINKQITHYLQQASTLLARGFQLTVVADQPVSEKILTQRLLPLYAGRDALLADLDLLANLYTDLIGCPHIGLRMEVLHGAMCPKFHVDRTGIRLLCTYMGPGTEWLDDSHADRSKLGVHTASINDEESGLILDKQGIHQAPPFAIALLKGSLWQGNQQRGVIHRSPVVPVDQSRVIVAIDALW